MFRTVQLLSPFTPGWFFVFNIVRPNNTTEEAFVEFAKSEVPDAKYLVGHDDTIYCFVPANISLEEIKAILDNQDVLPGTAKLFYLTSVSNFNDMLRVLDKSVAKSKKADAGKCDCGLCATDGRVLPLLEKFSKTIDNIPRNDATLAIVKAFMLKTVGAGSGPTMDDMRDLRNGLVGAIGEEAVTAAGFPLID
jgi:hypothetical protein